MSSGWGFLIILYTSQAFYGLVNSANVFVPPSKLLANREGASDRVNENKTAEETPEERRNHWFNFHHGTLASKVPVNKHHELQYRWHVTVYSKIDIPYEQICGGSLVKKDAAISAAHCFWDEAGLIPAEQFAVALGQKQRKWQDSTGYQSNVSEIIIPPRFLGILTNFQDDIAVVKLATPVEYKFGVKPVCVDFDLQLDRRQLEPGYTGLITGFGLTEANGEPSETLNFQKLPNVDIRECINASEPNFLKYLTSDKICAGDQKTGRALCRGDSGGGLIYFQGYTDDTRVPYIRGVASAAPRDNNKCNAFAIGSFTHVRAHRTFLRDHIPGLEEECKVVYAEALAPMISKYVLRPVMDTKAENAANKTDTNAKVDLDRVNATVITELLAVGQAKPDLNNANDTQTDNETQTNVGLSNVDRLQKPTNPSGFGIPLHGPIRPSASEANVNQNLNGLPSEVKIRGSPNTNIFFFTGSLVDAIKTYNQPNATPEFVPSRAEHPTNIYVFIQN